MNLFRQAIFLLAGLAIQHTKAQSLPNQAMVFADQDGIIAIEAEHFSRQSKTEIRKWVQWAPDAVDFQGQDPDPMHLQDASRGAYLEILPDTRATHDDQLISGENFSGEPGQMAILHYPVFISQPGKYYVWVRAYSTGTEDNGLHVGIDGTWPEHGQRMQWTAKNKWFWDCKQRTEAVHTGVPMEIYLDIDQPGLHEIQFSMREDGFEFDKFLLTLDKEYRPEGQGPLPTLQQGTLPPAFFLGAEAPTLFQQQLAQEIPAAQYVPAPSFSWREGNFYLNNDWLAINPNQHRTATASTKVKGEDGAYDLVFLAVGENDGKSSYVVTVNGRPAGTYTTPLSQQSFETGHKYAALWESIELNRGEELLVSATVGSEDGQEYSRGRWQALVIAPSGKGKDVLTLLEGNSISQQSPSSVVQAPRPPSARGENGNGQVKITGELRQWHKVTLTLDGPFAAETDIDPNPFTDYRMDVRFTHESGSPSYLVPGYFAADGQAAESSADKGNQWRAHLAPDKTGTWTYEISFSEGVMAAVMTGNWITPLSPFDGVKGSFQIGENNKVAPDFRAEGRLEYVGEHYLRFAGTGRHFLKMGTDAPETLLAYEDMDNTIARKSNVPLKSYAPHLADWRSGDPVWQEDKGKGLIGALNYLAGKGVNAFSFLTYNAGGDGDNVWPFVTREDKYHYDCSKLDQWEIVFAHAQSLGLYLHFKTQETENDDNRQGRNKEAMVRESLDGGLLGPQRKLYYRELVARYGHHLALNWNLGEENTQSTEAQQAMAAYFAQIDPYPHNIVLHTFPNQQEKVYTPLLGDKSALTGVSLQNEWNDVFNKTLTWRTASAAAGRPWVVANDEQGSAGEGVPPDPGYRGFDATSISYDLHDVRKQTLWGNLMAGGAGVEYYFGYKLPENDLVAQDFRSRDRSWEYGKVALDFFALHAVPFWEMSNQDHLIGNDSKDKSKHCLAKPGQHYLIYLAYTDHSTLDLSGVSGTFEVYWFNPRTGGELIRAKKKRVKGGTVVDLGTPPSDKKEDWLIWVTNKS
ncbi:MAG: DUF5060 domain-containing protein [Bacteroidia bacterium]|nr:DUF5060 domain-containing protein [Bacteroidia bacterium]